MWTVFTKFGGNQTIFTKLEEKMDTRVVQKNLNVES